MSTRLAMRPAAIVACVAAYGAGVVQDADAAQYGFYVAGYYGNSEKEATKPPFDDFANLVYAFNDFTAEQTTSSLNDGKDTSFGMMAGYRLLPHLALEAGYMDLGEIKYRNDSFGTHIDHQEPWQQNIGASTSGIAVSVLGILPLSYRWELYARAGGLIATNELDIFITDFFRRGNLEDSESSFEFLAGAGAALSFAEVYSLRLEFQRVFDAGHEIAQSDVDILSLGITVSF